MHCFRICSTNNQIKLFYVYRMFCEYICIIGSSHTLLDITFDIVGVDEVSGRLGVQGVVKDLWLVPTPADDDRIAAESTLLSLGKPS